MPNQDDCWWSMVVLFEHCQFANIPHWPLISGKLELTFLSIIMLAKTPSFRNNVSVFVHIGHILLNFGYVCLLLL